MSDQDTLARQQDIVMSVDLALRKQGKRVRRFETHISWVLVTDDVAYKFKKAVSFDFVDFATLDARHRFCMEELRLNRRLAPDLYLDVVSITGSPDNPAIDGSGPVMEYAVKMRAFDQQALWTQRLNDQSITPHEVDQLASLIAHFHQASAIASNQSAWCTPDALQAAARENVDVIAGLANRADERRWISILKTWDKAQLRTLRGVFVHRKEQGCVRDCHGDLHCGNILTVGERVEAFDCIEFNESLRCIDVVNDIAFTCMDLQFQGRTDLAARFLNAYLEVTGDYEGLAVLRYYQVQRALVRSKVALLRARQLPRAAPEAVDQRRQGTKYLEFAVQCTVPNARAVLITHGYSGSGKTTFSQHIVELTGAVRLRSDVERKRLHGIAATDRAAAMPDADIYNPRSTSVTYERLLRLAKQVVESGRPVVVDAAFLKAEQRALFRSLASELNVPFLIFDLQAEEHTLRARVRGRESLNLDASDAGINVLTRQFADHDRLSIDEMRNAIAIDMEDGIDSDKVHRACRPALEHHSLISSVVAVA